MIIADRLGSLKNGGDPPLLRLVHTATVNRCIGLLVVEGVIIPTFIAFLYMQVVPVIDKNNFSSTVVSPFSQYHKEPRLFIAEKVT